MIKATCPNCEEDLSEKIEELELEAEDVFSCDECGIDITVTAITEDSITLETNEEEYEDEEEEYEEEDQD